MELNYRIKFNDKGENTKAEYLLDHNDIDYDYDSAGRMMISIKGMALLDINDVDYEEV